MTNNDLISRTWVLSEYDRQHKGPPGGARKIMEEAPAVSAAPVVHARWKVAWRGFPHDPHTVCSNCDYDMDFDICTRIHDADHFSYSALRSNYCPRCGAKMDGRADDDTR